MKISDKFDVRRRKMMKISTRDAYGEALIRLGKENKDVVVLDADLSKSTRTYKFANVFPERFFNMGIAEQNMMGTAAGLATCGKIPFGSSLAVFATERAYNQVRQLIAYPRLNVKIVATHGGISVGEDGVSHQTTTDIAIMRALPNMTVIVPADAIETEMAIMASVKYEGPFYIRLGREPIPLVYEEGYRYLGRRLTFKVGRAVTLRDGGDVTIIATGILVAKALTAANILGEEGVEARVINIHTIKPIDQKTILQAAEETGAIVTAEEHSIIGGLGGVVAEVLTENYPIPIQRIGIKDEFGESGSAEELLIKYGLTASNMVHAAKEVIKMKS